MIQSYLKNSTLKVNECLQATIMELANLRKNLVTVEAVFLALLEQKDSVVIKVLEELETDVGAVRASLVEKLISRVESLSQFQPNPSQRTGDFRISEDINILFEEADDQRKKLGDGYISTGAVFLACFSERLKSTRSILESVSLSYDDAFKALDIVRSHKKITSKDSESRMSLLDEYTKDLTSEARHGNLDPVVSRDKEIDEVIQILSRRKKNNPILTGEPGVGKTVVVEGLAQKIVNGDVPEYLLNRRVLSLEMGALIAGAKVQGEFEDRLTKIMDEIKQSAGEIILFIDEFHTIIGAGRSSGALDASNMLKPALARGELQCIGATTNREYKKFIESDKALVRRFQMVRIDEPSIKDTVEIMRGLKSNYEEHHKVEYSDDALLAACEFSSKYITDRFLPDKAIDLIDEAGAQKRLQAVFMPKNIRDMEKERSEILLKKKKHFDEQDFENMAKHQMELTQIEEKLKNEIVKFNESMPAQSHIVTREDIAAVVSKKTRIPVGRIGKSDGERLKGLEAKFSERVIGQQKAIESVANAIRRNRAGLRRPNAPIASFLFLGPTGVGKTELCKVIAQEVLDDESRLIRVDMSEYMERHDVSKLIGSPPGYVGYGEGGQLTEQVKQQPYSVILFDEIEKAHPDVFNLLLQVLDEGWLTDGEGEKVNFRNCIIVGTSNIGSDILVDRKKPVGLVSQHEEFDQSQEQSAIMAEVRRFLKPEFINRLDEIIVFNRLTKTELEKIIHLQLEELSKRLSKLDVVFDLDKNVSQYLLESLNELSFGARPIRRKIETLIENTVANLLISEGASLKSKKVQVKVIDGAINVKAA